MLKTSCGRSPRSKKMLKNDDSHTLQKSLTYHDRSEPILPPGRSQVQQQLYRIAEYAEENKIKINKSKTKIMLFNNARTRDFTESQW